MKPTPITNRDIEVIKRSLDFLRNISNIEHTWPLYKSTDNLVSVFTDNLYDLQTISCNEISNEFLTCCNNVDEIKGLRQVFKIRFKKILEWISHAPIDIKASCIDNANALNNLFYHIELKEGELSAEKRQEISDLYIKNFLNLAMIKSKLLELFEEWEAMSLTSLHQNTIDELVQKETNHKSGFRISPKRKTDFLKIISSMYDCRMFETQDGYIASNKQELMNEFGRFLGEDFSKYSISLSQSKKVAEETFLKPFKEIEQNAKGYYQK